MCAPIPKGKWSWKHEKCLSCGTKKTKHKGNGLCLNCHDKKRALKPHRREQLKRQHDRWYARVKDTEEHREYQRVRCAKWQNEINPEAHKRNWQRRNLKKIFERFLLNKRRKLKRDNGLQIRIGNKLVQTNIPPADSTTKETDTTIMKIDLFKQVYSKLFNACA